MCKTRAPGTDKRPSAARRRATKQYLLDLYGDGTTCPCVHCGRTLTFATLTQDRILPGSMGGRYVRANLQPACLPCNSSRGDNTAWQPTRKAA